MDVAQPANVDCLERQLAGLTAESCLLRESAPGDQRQSTRSHRPCSARCPAVVVTYLDCLESHRRSRRRLFAPRHEVGGRGDSSQVLPTAAKRLFHPRPPATGYRGTCERSARSNREQSPPASAAT